MENVCRGTFCADQPTKKKPSTDKDVASAESDICEIKLIVYKELETEFATIAFVCAIKSRAT